MEVCVYGAGALGSLMGGMLSSENEVTLICRQGHADAVNRNGLTLEGLENRRVHCRAVTSMQDMKGADLILATVKAYDTKAAMKDIGLFRPEGAEVAFIQNGLTILDDARLIRPAPAIGIATLGAMCIAPGVVRFTGRGEVVVGMMDRDGAPARIVDALASAGLPCRTSHDIRADVWRKAVVNCCINPITALLGRTNGVIVQDQSANYLARTCFAEAMEVALASGATIGGMSFETVEEIAAATASNRSSMLQDIERGRRTEIDQINGEIVRRAELLGIDVPVNRDLTEKVRGKGWPTSRRSNHNISN